MKTKARSFSKETTRIVKVGANVGTFVAKVATKNLLGISKSNKNANELTELLGGLKGPLMKIAQILATIPDAIPEEYAEQLSKLQAEAPAMGWFFVKRRMRQELGQDWQRNFSYFEKNASKAASLGQVHKVKLLNSDIEMACKLQYPDMISTINADLKQLKLIAKIYKKIERTIDTDEIYKEIEERLFEEIDYNNEFKNILIYKNIFEKNKNICVPEPYKKLSTSKLITMSWLEGTKLNKFYKASLSDRNYIAKNLFTAWYLPFYKYGIIHGDPHPGNYTIGSNSSILNLLDYGSIRTFTPEFVEGVIKLYRALKNDNQQLATEAYKSWGFKNLNKSLVDALNIWASYLYGPLIDNKTRKIQDHNSASYGKQLLGEVRKELKKYGGIKPPREFVLVDRAAIGLGSVFMHLNAELNWHSIFENLIANFSKEKLHRNQKSIIKKSVY